MEYYHLTTPQQNIWNLQKYYGDTAIGNQCGAVFYKEKRDNCLLQQAIYQFIQGQSGIRLRFLEKNEPVSFISCEEPEEISVITFSSVDEFDSYAKEFAKEPLGLTDRAMYRFVIFEAEGKSGILAVLSHLISDAWTFSLMANQVDAAYRNLADGAENTLFEADYTEYIQTEKEYFASARYEKDRKYWEEKYAVRPEKSMIKIYSAGKQSIKAGRFSKNLPPDLEHGLRNYCKAHSVTPAVMFEAALIIYLSRINPENDTVTIGVPVLNRSNVREKKTAGMFVSTMPLTAAVREDMAVTELTGQITKEHMDIFRHQKYPYSEILKALRKSQNFTGNLYDVMISYQNAKTMTEADTKWYSNGYSEVPFVIHIDNRDGHSSHTINADYQTGIFRDRREAADIISRLEYILYQITEDKIKSIKEIKIVPQPERTRVLEEFNDTHVDYPREKCVHELFTEQAARTPDRIALVFEDRKFTYRELDEMSNSLAHFLREKGVKPNDVVPIIAKRSWHVVAAMLGVLKAGGAYMPVSPEFPQERIRYMVETAGAKLALTCGYCMDKDNPAICGTGIETVALEDADYSADTYPVRNRNETEDLCYIIFTSGSTGQPKGVEISHGNVMNYCDNNNNNVCHAVISDDNKSIVSVTNIVFDIFVTESLLPLLNGMTIYMADDEEAVSQNRLSELIKNNKIDVMQTTPTKMKSLMQDRSNLEYLSVLKTIILGGEALTKELYREVSLNTEARVFNIYGPAETTVWSSNKEIKNDGSVSADINVGCSFKKLDSKKKCVHELFTEQAARTPDRIALIAGDEKYTYRELDKKSDALAQKLITQGISAGKAVGAYLDRTAYVVISQLAVLKAGGVFLPIDHRYPKDRIKYMLEDCRVEMVVSDRELVSEWNIKYINLTKYDFKDTPGNPVKISPEAPCYVIYTSGSTGKPKGCVLSHKGIANFCINNNIVPYAEKLDHQTVISVNTISFDFFIAETLLPLLHGWTVVLAGEEESRSKNLFKRLVIENNVNIIETTPTRLKIYSKDEKENGCLRQIRLIVSSGEELSDSLLRHLKTVSPAKIYNTLGPSECSVWNTDGDFSTDITIGRPIANTQIYILDKDMRPVPVGVAGELCIAGDGVGKGYLNRPELTAEKFVPNPFATEENRHGKVMYRTGDLARWREDGEIEYLGRIDTQVKIRGLRIELGEIESVMGGFAGIRLTAAAAQKDDNGRQYLAGYYTAEGEIDEKELRKYLSSKLPKYMVPNYFVRLDAMPMTASGKTDRKSLPLPDFTVRTGDYVEPETDIEVKLCRLLETLLNMEKIGAEDDFFEAGGDSLTVMEYAAKAHDMGIEFSIQNVFDYPTVRKLCSFLSIGTEEKVSYEISDFDKYREIFDKNVADDSAVFEKNPLGSIFLTGATGFLGAHVLDRLMQEESGRIYCLVRGSETCGGQERLSWTLKYYFGNKYESEFGRRIIPVEGDIEREGISDNMPSDVHTVIHTAASVKHFGSYDYFHKVNTEGTQHVIDYTKAAGARLIHISTLSVSGNSMADDFTVYRSEEEKFFHETSFYIGQPLDNVYIHSKFEAEKRVYDAMLGGLPAVVIRVGNLTNRASDYKFQPNFRENAFLTRFKSILEFGLFPDYLMKLYSEFSPVDKTAEGIVKIAQYAAEQTVFHLNSSKVIYFERFLEVVRELGIAMKVVDGASFNEELQKTIKNSRTEYIFEAFQNDMDEEGRLVYDSNIRIKNDFTLWFLKKTGFEWNETDMEYIRGYVEYFRQIGYLEV